MTGEGVDNITRRGFLPLPLDENLYGHLRMTVNRSGVASPHRFGHTAVRGNHGHPRYCDVWGLRSDPQSGIRQNRPTVDGHDNLHVFD